MAYKEEQLLSAPTAAILQPSVLRVSLGLIVALLAALSGAAAQPYETPPPLAVSEVLSAEMQRGESFTVRDPVRNDGFMNHYIVDSNYGQFQAYGTPALAKLIQEIKALDQLEEISKSDVFVDAVKRSATSQVDAIQDFADKPVETVKGVPGGLKKSFRKYKRDAKEGYETAKDATGIGDDDGEGDGEGDPDSPDVKEVAEKTGDAAEAYAKKWFGVSGAERRWHQKMGTDPYTTNQVLKKRIKELSRVDAAAGTGMRFVPIPRIPGAGELRALNQMVWNVDPRELRDQNIQRLAEAGVEEELIDEFMNNPWFSPSAQTVLLTSLLEMEGVEGRRALLEIAVATESAEEAQFDLANIVFLSEYHRSVEPLTQVRSGRVAVAITQEGDMLKVVSVDYAFWQEDLAGAITAFIDSVAGQPATAREIWLRGKASPRFQQELRERAWTVHEAFELDLRKKSAGS